MIHIISNRVDRDRQNALIEDLDRRRRRTPPTTARRLVQVYNGGSMPATTGKWFLTHPVDLDGAECEGCTATQNVDTTDSIPVLVIGSTVPSVGDFLTAHMIGGKWVAERGGSGGPGNFTCGSCAIPKENLAVSWTNLILGPGSATLVYAGSPATQWISACTNQLLYELVCNQNQVEFRVYYFLSGSCPTGQSQYCSTLRSNPYGLTQTGLTCGASFLMTCTLTSSTCPNLASYGYTSFTVSA